MTFFSLFIKLHFFAYSTQQFLVIVSAWDVRSFMQFSTCNVCTLQVLKKNLFSVGTTRDSMNGFDFGLVKSRSVIE